LSCERSFVPARGNRMPFDGNAAQALAVEAARSFGEGLRCIVSAASALVAEQELRATQELLKLTEERGRLLKERQVLELDRSRFEEERRLFAPGGVEMSDMVPLNVGDEVMLAVLRSTLTQCTDSMLAAAFSGRWELPRDKDGRVFIDFPSMLFVPLIEHLRMRRIEDDHDHAPPPPYLGSADLEAQFQRMLRYYGVEDWVYRRDPVAHSLSIGDQNYGVLPPRAPEENEALSDMKGQIVEVPRGWEVLSSTSEAFDDVIRELTSHGWGAAFLCVINEKGGFDGYRTTLHSGGPAGSISSLSTGWPEVTGEDERSYEFPSSSYRLVVRSIGGQRRRPANNSLAQASVNGKSSTIAGGGGLEGVT